MVYVDNIFNILKPDNDHIWSKHIASMISEQILISSIPLVSSVANLYVVL
jgi:hypothetical protein